MRDDHWLRWSTHIGRENVLQMSFQTITAGLHRVGPAVVAGRAARAPLGPCSVRRGQLGPGRQTRADARARRLGVVEHAEWVAWDRRGEEQRKRRERAR